MTPLLATLLLTPAAPVPKAPRPHQFDYAYLGVRMKSASRQLIIEAPEPGTPARKAGLREGDEIVQLGTLRPTEFDEIAEYIIDHRPGTELYVEVRRNGKIHITRLTLGTRPDTPDYNPRDIFLKRQGIPFPDNQ